jgi:hypothetical protein
MGTYSLWNSLRYGASLPMVLASGVTPSRSSEPFLRAVATTKEPMLNRPKSQYPTYLAVLMNTIKIIQPLTCKSMTKIRAVSMWQNLQTSVETCKSAKLLKLQTFESRVDLSLFVAGILYC